MSEIGGQRLEVRGWRLDDELQRAEEGEIKRGGAEDAEGRDGRRIYDI